MNGLPHLGTGFYLLSLPLLLVDDSFVSAVVE